MLGTILIVVLIPKLACSLGTTAFGLPWAVSSTPAGANTYSLQVLLGPSGPALGCEC
jgi:hypothetical protein